GIRGRNVTGVQTCALPIFEPDVEDLRDPTHHGPAGRVVRVRPSQIIDPGPVEVDLAGVVERQTPEVGFDRGQGDVDVGARISGVRGHPYEDWRYPGPLARYRH